MKLKLSIIVALIVATLFSCSLNQNNIGSVPVNVSEIYKQVREATGATNEQIKIVVSIEGDRGYKKNQTIEGLKSEEQIKQKTIFAEGIRIGETVVIDVKIYVQGKIKYSAHNSVKINSEKTKVLFAFVPVEQSTVPLDFVLVKGTTINTQIADSEVFVEDCNIEINDFCICDHEVTQAEYELYCSYAAKLPENHHNTEETKKPNDKYGKGENYPAYYVSLYDALVYCNMRSFAEGLERCYYFIDENKGIIYPEDEKYIPTSYNSELASFWYSIKYNNKANGYRLPTTIEWEYAARGGKDGITGTQFIYAGSDNIEEVAWCESNSNYKTHEVKTKKSNGLELFDMNGNVCEWVWSDDSFWGYFCGGDYSDGGGIPYLSNSTPDVRLSWVGFRLVRSIR